MKLSEVKNVFPSEFYGHTFMSNPTIQKLQDGYFLYYSDRDNDNRSLIYRLLLTNDFTVRGLPELFSEVPLNSEYAFSGLGCGDISRDGKLWCMGWQNPDLGHWRGDIVSVDLNTGSYDDMPLLKSSPKESFSYPHFAVVDNVEHVYFGNTYNNWRGPSDEMIHVIEGAIKLDNEWYRIGRVGPCIIGVGQAFSRPYLHAISEDDFTLIYSYRGGADKYKIGFSKSNIHTSFGSINNLFDNVMLQKGLDDEMQCYPYLVSANKKYYLFYNGNDFGKTGIIVRELTF